MKLNKTMGRVATTLVATAMLASVAVVPAFATDGEGDQKTPPPSGLQDGTFEIAKNLKVGEKVFTPKVSFHFNIQPENPTVTDDVTEVRNGVTVEAGQVGDIVWDNDASFNAGTAAMTQDTVVKADQNAAYHVDLSKFTLRGPGVYKYKVTEDTSNPYNGITYDNSIKYLYVTIIQGDSGLEVASTELVNNDAEHTKTNDFNNDYDADTETLHDVTIHKFVEGQFGDKFNDSFTFNVKVEGEEEETYYVEYVEGGNETTMKTDSLQTGVEKNFTVRNGGYVKIYGLDSDDKYTVTETDYADKGYVAYTDTDYNAGDTHETNGSTKGDKIDKATISADTDVAIYNVKTSTPATGIVMDIAPYALLVVVAAAGCFVFMRKRRED